MKDNEFKLTVCPKCGKIYTEPPALSRKDGVTFICPDCGTKEALESIGILADEQEKIIHTIHKATKIN